MKALFTRHIRYLFAIVVFLAGVLPTHAAPGTEYTVDWPGIHLSGGFTLDVGPGFGSYLSSSASGTYGGINGSFNVSWTQVEFDAQPNFAELKFILNQTFTGYAVSPAYVGRPLPWSSADEAWHDLIIKGATEGVYISTVPEPAAAVFLTSLPLLILWRRRNR